MTKTTHIALKGLTCNGCVTSLTTALMSNPALENVTVTLSPAQATVTYDPLHVTPETLCALIEEAGFEGSILD